MNGFQLSGTLQYYSKLPLNITSASRRSRHREADRGRGVHRRNAGTGPDFLTLNLRLSRTFALRGPVRLEALAEVFNLTNRENVVAMNGNFGSGAYPTNPSATFGQITAVGEPRSVQFALRLSF